MSNVAIVTDSTAYIPASMVAEYGITVAPLLVNWDEHSYQDGIDIQPTEFYERLKTSKSLPTSSQVPVATFDRIFRDLREHGREILTITLSSKFSGTLDSAIQAKADMVGEPIELVDSYSASMGAGLIVLAAARAAKDGASLAECKALTEQATHKSGLFLTVDTLEFLHRGGRIGGGSRFLGTALNIKPILEIVDGKLEASEKVRTRNKAAKRLVELVSERINGRSPVRLAAVHANAAEDAQAMLDLAVKELGAVEAIVSDVSPVIGVHVGPGTIGLSYQFEM